MEYKWQPCEGNRVFFIVEIKMVSGEADPLKPCHILAKLSPSKRPTKKEAAPGKSTAEKIFIKV